ncbi:MAG: NUDIX hydrolase [Elusimicrobia bacterium]|nr:NUDIX hydrolase [Elusimicrobiota bacterium]
MRRDDSHLIETKIRTKPVYRGNAVNFFVDQVRLPNGKKAEREYLDHPGAVAAIPILDRDTVIMVRQYRYPVREVTYEIPAGKLAAGEAPLPCVRRELKEETGFTAGRIRRLISYWPTPAFSDEVLHIYVAEDLRPGTVCPDEDEFLEVKRVPLRRALDWVFEGKIRDSKSVIALLAYSLRRR